MILTLVVLQIIQQQRYNNVLEVDEDEYGRPVAHTPVALSDGNYEAKIIVEQIHPVEFLIEGR